MTEPEAHNDITRPPVSNSAPFPVEPLKAPETGDQSGLAEAAILGSGSKFESQTTDDGKMQDSQFDQDPFEDHGEEDDPAQPNHLNSETGPLHDSETSSALWRQYQQLTQGSASHLTEQLRLILEPTTATCLQGDYLTGKRLNMRKLVHSIASDYTKDRIWLRRGKPAQRDYKILLAVEDSRSMADSRFADLAFQTLALVTSTLQAGSWGSCHSKASPIEGFTLSQH